VVFKNCFQLRKKKGVFHFPSVPGLKEYLHCSIFSRMSQGFHFGRSLVDGKALRSSFHSGYFLGTFSYGDRIKMSSAKNFSSSVPFLEPVCWWYFLKKSMFM